MLNKPPAPSSTSSVINSYRKRRQQRGPFLIYGAAALLILVGVILLVMWLMGPSQPLASVFATETPTPTLTFTSTVTNTPTETATITLTPTLTSTSTPNAPFPYTIQEGDTLVSIAEKFKLGDDGVLLILDLNPEIVANDGFYYVGETIQIPVPGTKRATSTPIPADLARGTKIEYKVLPGDTLAGIAARFNSKEEDIIKENKIEDANALQVGQILQIPVNLVTATATRPPTSTSAPPTPIPGQATDTPQPSPTSPAPPANCTSSENPSFVSELQTLINNARASNGLPTLTLNEKLSAAAKAHSLDMACNDYKSHTGSDGSTPQMRVAAQGYAGSLIIEDIYALPPQYGGNAQSAFNWWMNDPTSRADLLNPNTSEFGIAYILNEKSQLGGYFTVISAKP